MDHNWHLLEPGFDMRINENAQLEIRTNTPTGHILQVQTLSPLACRRLREFISWVHWESVEKRALEVDPTGMLSAAYEAGRASLVNLEKATQWISVEERLPELGQECAVSIENGDYSYRRWGIYKGAGLWSGDGGHSMSINDPPRIHRVTHWMPLPDPPLAASPSGLHADHT
jgi:hypothetical protein